MRDDYTPERIECADRDAERRRFDLTMSMRSTWAPVGFGDLQDCEHGARCPDCP